jgi:hypothetical protein
VTWPKVPDKKTLSRKHEKWENPKNSLVKVEELCFACGISWIPACAGMTRYGALSH